MYEKESPHHAEYHDNMFCHDHDETVEFMQDVTVPWIAFKVLAEAGPVALALAYVSGDDATVSTPLDAPPRSSKRRAVRRPRRG